MAKNSNLQAAKAAKNDEFYTQLTDIENELIHYRNQLNGKKVYCNCDDPNFSNFWLYFMLQFNMLNLQELTATCYREGSKGIKWKIRRVPGIENIRDLRLPEGQVYIEKTELEGDGDFRSPECIEELENCDVVITNPPFSLFREFVDTVLVKHNKDLLIIGNMNAITYKEIFPLLKDNRLWLGYAFNASFVYKAPYVNTLEANRKFVIGKGYNPDEGYIKVPACCWFSTLDTTIRHEDLIVNVLYKKYYDNPEEYPKYDNYDAINVDKTSDIPIDYYGVMGVPITYLGKHNPDQFEIIGLLQSSTDEQAGIPNLHYYNDFKEMRQDMTFTGASGVKANGNPVLKGKSLKGNFLFNPTTNEYVHSIYARINIKRKYKEDGTVNQ